MIPKISELFSRIGAGYPKSPKRCKTPLDIAVETEDKGTIALLAEGITKCLRPK
jgi:hypothetical protein